jgi:hypothetical protein
VKLKLVAVCSTAVLALCAIGTAAAGNPGQKQPQTVKAHIATLAQGTGVDVGAVFDAAVAYLQIDKQTLFQKLKSGQSLTQIAVAQGKTADGLVNAVVAAAQTQLDKAVAAGKLSAAKEQALLTKLRTKLGTLVAKSSGSSASRPSSVTAFLQPLLAYLHLDISTVLNELRSGKSLAQIAVAQGKTADGLTSAIVASAKVKLDAQVAAGKLTAAQEAALLAKLQTTAAALVSSAHA